MSGYANISAVGDPNILYKALSGAGTTDIQRNQLLNQQTQQAIGDNEMKVMGQAAQGLLNMPDEASRAAAYPGEIARLQALGLAKNAPSVYPGEDRLKSFVATSLPVADQYNLGLAVNPVLTKQLQQLYGGGAPAAPAAGSGTAAAPGGGFTGDREHDRALIVAKESGGDPTALNYVAKADPTAYARGATASGKYQFVNDTWRDGMKLAGLDPAKYPTAREAPEAVQDQVFNAVYARDGFKPWLPTVKDWIKDENGRYQLATVRPQLATPPAAPGGGVVARNPGAVQVAGPGAPTPPAAPVAPPAATTDLVGPRPLPPTGAGAAVVTPASLANTPVPIQQNALAPPPAPVTTAQAQPPAAAPAAPPAPGAAQQPPQQPALPHRWEVPTGTSTPQFQQAQALLARAATAKAIAAQAPPNSPIARQAAVAAARDEQLAASLQQADNIVQTQEGQLNTRTGEVKETAKPLADYHETTPGSGVWVGGPGTEPRFQPPGRLVVGPDGTVWQTGVSGAKVLQPSDPQAIAARKAAEAVGTGTGTAVAKQLPELIAQARNAAQQEGQIDYATNQLREAAKGNIPTGYFSGALATAAAAAKSLGIDTTALGVDPKAVGNIQTAQKTLAVIGGAILQQAIGKNASITDAKIEHFIHTQPGIETDPQALERIMAWARSQYTYEREMGTAAVNEAAKSSTGTLPLNWQAAYYRDHGFAPIYDPGTGEMQQPDGRQPTRETPPAAPTAPINPTARETGKTYSTPKGPMKWTGTVWVNP